VDNPEDLETFSIESMQSCMGCFNSPEAWTSEGKGVKLNKKI
jgi:hypothetical protein